MTFLSRRMFLWIASGVLVVAPAVRGSQAASEKAQGRLIRQVRHELITLPYYGVFDQLSFRLQGRTVTLLGQVTRPTLKSDAEGVVKNIEGVENVENKIEVLPLSPNDDRLRLALYRAIYGQPTPRGTLQNRPMRDTSKPANRNRQDETVIPGHGR